MIYPAHMLPILTRTSHPRLEEWPSPCPHSPRTKRRAARHVIPRRLAMPAPLRTQRAIDDDADVLKVWPVHSPAHPYSHGRMSEPGPLQPGGSRVLAATNLSAGRLRKAPSLLDLPCSPSVTRSVLFPRPAALRGSALHGPERLKAVPSEVLAHAPFGFRLSENLSCKERKNIFRTFRKSAAGPWERGTFTTPARRERVLGDPGTRVASRKSVPRIIRANTTKEKHHGTIRKQDHFERLPR